MTAQKKIINAKDIKPYIMQGSTYESRMLLDDIVAGEPTVNINHGTIKPLQTAGGGSHEKTEIYFIVSGNGLLRLDNETHVVSQGSLAVIPGMCEHSITNTGEIEDLVILTVWMNAKDNDVYNMRVREWGKSFMTINDD